MYDLWSMEPQNTLPPTPPPDVTLPPLPQTPIPTAPIQPSPPVKSKKLLIIVALLILLGGSAIVAWFMTRDKDTPTPTDNSAPAATTGEVSSDKQGIQAAVDAYCKVLGDAYGFAGMDSGYIISDRFSEEELSDSPDLLRFKQVGDAAYGTVDCEDAQGPNGISNDLLFVKQDGVWSYVDEVQNHSGTGFDCGILEKHNVSKELVRQCAPSEQAPTQPR